MEFLGSRLQPISLEDGISAILFSLIGTLAVGTLLLAAGHSGQLALAALPVLLVGALAHAAGVKASDNPKAMLIVCALTFHLHQTVSSIAAIG
ncbi:hypothetical protein ACFFGH_17680 [Lysobacter korlensis]|uniref:Uncharacterized protein n=1 Tax=Lysobacter korlensis TaxID=553636 RepID=A0ABV6RRR8_9GAMM